MKLRIQNDSIRIRLNDKEVDRLAEGVAILSETWFPESKLVVSLAIGSENQADFIDHTIRIIVNADNVKTWASSDDVSIPMSFNLPDDKKLSILVEKDMKM